MIAKERSISSALVLYSLLSRKAEDQKPGLKLSGQKMATKRNYKNSGEA